MHDNLVRSSVVDKMACEVPNRFVMRLAGIDIRPLTLIAKVGAV